MLLFKYLSPKGASAVLANAARLELRFSLPNSYSDPYELFLQPDRALEHDDQRALFEALLGSVPLLPVSCFSRVPDSPTMWAHYCRDSSGLCLGFDEDALVGEFPICYVEDVCYSDDPAQIDSELVARAALTGKRRHALYLLEEGLRAAYFTKKRGWEYECERRVVVDREAVSPKSTYFVAHIRPTALRYLILGPKVKAELRKNAAKLARKLGLHVLELRIGKRAYEPWFEGPGAKPVVRWHGDRFEDVEQTCAGCGEACAVSIDGLCSSCDVGPDGRAVAARNMLFVSVALGMEEFRVSFAGLEPRGFEVRSTKK